MKIARSGEVFYLMNGVLCSEESLEAYNSKMARLEAYKRARFVIEDDNVRYEYLLSDKSSIMARIQTLSIAKQIYYIEKYMEATRNE